VSGLAAAAKNVICHVNEREMLAM